jgi:outer membrane lipoprotein SlyB
MNTVRTVALMIMLPTAALISTSVSAQANTFNANQAGRAQTVQMGTVYAVRDVTIQNEGTRTGNVTGAALGGIAGSTLGSGSRANTAGAIGGAVAGRAVGNRVTSSNQSGVEITVRLDSNLLMSVVQAGNSNEFRVGDAVRVTSDGQTTRVIRN